MLYHESFNAPHAQVYLSSPLPCLLYKIMFDGPLARQMSQLCRVQAPLLIIQSCEDFEIKSMCV